LSCDRPVGRCPACGGNVYEGARNYGCENDHNERIACRFVIWKRIAHREITPEIVAQLLDEGGTEVLEGFVSRENRPFSASLRLEQGEKGWKVVFAFGSTGGSLGKCPACGGNVVEQRRSYSCANWRPAHGACRFTIWKNTAGRDLTREEASRLLRDGATDLLTGFTSRAGIPFSARLRLVKDDAGQFKARFEFTNGR